MNAPRDPATRLWSRVTQPLPPVAPVPGQIAPVPGQIAIDDEQAHESTVEP